MSNFPHLTIATLAPEHVRIDDRSLHTLIESAAGQDRSTCRVLWARPARETIIIQSIDFDPGMIPGVLFSTHRNPEPVRATWPTGSEVHIDIIANIRRKHGRQIIPVPPEDRIAWITERLPMLKLKNIQVENLAPIRASKAGNQVTISRAAFSADATVQDPGELQRSILQGLGGGKAYGCGLLLVSEVAQ